MKNRILVIGLFATLITLLWLFGPASQIRNPERAGSNARPQLDGVNAPPSRAGEVVPARPLNPVAAPRGLTNIAPSSFAVPSNVPPDLIANAQRLYEERTRGKVSAWVQGENVPVDFWGKVVEQSNNPIAGVAITATIREWYSLLTTADAKFHQVTTQTDGEGRFRIGGAKGDVISIKGIAKSGYELKPKQILTYDYKGLSGFKPDPANPVVFKMWKQSGAEPLYIHEINTRLPVNSGPMLFNLTDYLRRGNEKDRSDVQISVEQGEATQSGVKPRFDWKIVIAAVDGGVQVAADEFLNLAPEHGYSNMVEIVSSAADPEWKSRNAEKIYFKSGDGRRFGSLAIKVEIYYGTPTCRLEIVSKVNPGGSRVLERSSAQQINRNYMFRDRNY